MSHLWPQGALFNLRLDPHLQSIHLVNLELILWLSKQGSYTLHRNGFTRKKGLRESTFKTITTFVISKLEIVSISKVSWDICTVLKAQTKAME